MLVMLTVYLHPDSVQLGYRLQRLIASNYDSYLRDVIVSRKIAPLSEELSPADG